MQQQAHGVVPAQFFAEHQPRKDDEHDQRDGFLDDLQLIAGELPVAEPVGGHHQAVFEKRDAPGNQDGQSRAACRAEISECPYQAKVMKMFDAQSRRIVVIADSVRSPRPLAKNATGPRDWLGPPSSVKSAYSVSA